MNKPESSKLSNVFLLLLETEEQYSAYINYKERIEPHDLLVCCLSVKVIDFCRENKIKYILPEECFTDEESNQYRVQSEEKVLELVRNINVYYHKKHGDQEGFKFDMGNYHFFMLYHYFGALHHRAFLLSKVFQKINASRILVPKEPEMDNFHRKFPVSQYKNCYLELCLNSAYREKVVPIHGEFPVDRQFSTLKMRIRSFVGKYLRKNRFANRYLNFVQSGILVNPLSILPIFKRRDILLVGGAGQWKYVVADSRLRNRITVISDNDEVNVSPLDQKNWFADWFQWEDIFCGFNVAELGYYEMARVKAISEKHIASFPCTIKTVKRFKALIYSVAPYASWQYLLSIASHLKIPCVCLQHGEMSLYHPGHWNLSSELLYASHYFSYGDKVSEEKKISAENSGRCVKAVSIGSPALDNLYRAPVAKNRCILFASAKYLNNSAGFVPRYCDLSLKNCQSLLIDYFERYLSANQNARVVWKQNQERLTLQAGISVERVTIIREEKTFFELLKDAEIVVLDRPTTTTVETCMTEKPLFVLLSNRNWYPLPEKLLKKRAVVTNSPEELCDAIDKYLKLGIYQADTKNREFVKAYGSHLDDGLSSRRAADELLNIINQGDSCVTFSCDKPIEAKSK